jgi:hypothetical protein
MASGLFSLRLVPVLTSVPSRTHYGYLPFEGRFPRDDTVKFQQKQQVSSGRRKTRKTRWNCFGTF